VRPRWAGALQWVLFVLLALGLGGCAGVSSLFKSTPDLSQQGAAPSSSAKDLPDAPKPDAQPAVTDAGPPVAPADSRLAAADPVQISLQLAQQKGPGRPSALEPELEEYDPWEPFNEKMFEFNRGLDRWVLKPVAKGYNKIMPDPLQEGVSNGFDNIAFVPRFVNCMLQGKFAGAGREILRFVINSSVGIGGLFDVAGTEGFKKCKEDMGQTLGKWGAGPGAYLVLPFLPPLTVRDAVGFFVDGAMDPASYLLPFFSARFPMKAGDTINDRSVNLDLYQGFEESTVEFYSALRNAYLQRRKKLIEE